MKVFGLDFTSAPTPGNPITLAEGAAAGHSVTITRLGRLTSFQAFERFLASAGRWIAAMDFPFGQPEGLIRELAWPPAWREYVERVGSMEREEFGALLEAYRRGHPGGSKQLLRPTDRRANALSPMMWHGVPLARMFYEGAPRLLRSDVSIIPCRPANRSRIAVEGYPALVARTCLGRRRYKDHRKPAPEGPILRRQLLRLLGSGEGWHRYGLRLAVDPAVTDECVGDDRGDRVDAVLCALQAAWAYSQRGASFGIPLDCNPNEGWIVDPCMTV